MPSSDSNSLIRGKAEANLKKITQISKKGRCTWCPRRKQDQQVKVLGRNNRLTRPNSARDSWLSRLFLAVVYSGSFFQKTCLTRR